MYKKSIVHPSTLLGACSLLSVVLVFSAFGCGTFAQGTEGKKAPDFALRDLENNSIRLSDYKGKVVLLDFWATWCPPCREEIPHLVEIYKKYKDNIIIIGLSLDKKDIPALKGFVKQYNINYPIVFADNDTVSAYGGIKYIPTLFVIDKEGMIRDKFTGYTAKETLEQAIKQALQ